MQDGPIYLTLTPCIKIRLSHLYASLPLGRLTIIHQALYTFSRKGIVSTHTL